MTTPILRFEGGQAYTERQQLDDRRLDALNTIDQTLRDIGNLTDERRAAGTLHLADPFYDIERAVTGGADILAIPEIDRPGLDTMVTAAALVMNFQGNQDVASSIESIAHNGGGRMLVVTSENAAVMATGLRVAIESTIGMDPDNRNRMNNVLVTFRETTGEPYSRMGAQMLINMTRDFLPINVTSESS